MLSSIFDRFVEESPISVMARGLMERVFAPTRMNALFENHAQEQFQQELLFSSQVDLMSLVVCGIQKSVHAAYKAKAIDLTVSTTALYNKLCGVELRVSQALLRETAQDLLKIVQQMGGVQPNPCPGYDFRILDGTCLAGTDHRLAAIRQFAAKALPGKVIAVLDPISKLVVDIFLLEDGHAQERSEFDEILATVKEKEIWIGDRNFCTKKLLMTIDLKKAFFVIRQHGSLGYKTITELKEVGTTETGIVFEQEVEVEYKDKNLRCRRIVVKLFKPTRDKEVEIAILTNLPNGMEVAEIYRSRWKIETLFQVVTENFNGEITTLAYPKAALFSFSMALATYNILATVKSALGSVHGMNEVDDNLSDYYVVNEIQGIYRGMMIAIPASNWKEFEGLSEKQIGLILQKLAKKVDLQRFKKAKRGVKKKRENIIVDRKKRHVSTSRLLNEYQNPLLARNSR
jgi:Transposase DDE domain